MGYSCTALVDAALPVGTGRRWVGFTFFRIVGGLLDATSQCSDRRPEFAGSAGSTGLAGMPGVAERRLRRRGDLPEGPGGPEVRGTRRRLLVQVQGGAGHQR